MPDLTAHITHLLERSEEFCALRFKHRIDQRIAQPSKKEATMQGYLYGFENALKLLQAMLDEDIEPPKRVET